MKDTVHGLAGSIIDDAGSMMATTHEEWQAAKVALFPMDRFNSLDVVVGEIVSRANAVGLAPVALDRLDKLTAALRHMRLTCLRIPTPASRDRMQFNENMPDEHASIAAAFVALNAVSDLLNKLGPTEETKTDDAAEVIERAMRAVDPLQRDVLRIVSDDTKGPKAKGIELLNLDCRFHSMTAAEFAEVLGAGNIRRWFDTERAKAMNRWRERANRLD